VVCAVGDLDVLQVALHFDASSPWMVNGCVKVNWLPKAVEAESWSHWENIVVCCGFGWPSLPLPSLNEPVDDKTTKGNAREGHQDEKPECRGKCIHT
jgi:hypothetical protein